MNETTKFQFDEILRLFEGKMKLLYGETVRLTYEESEGILSFFVGEKSWTANWKPAEDGSLQFFGRALDEVRTKMEVEMVNKAINA